MLTRSQKILVERLCFRKTRFRLSKKGSKKVMLVLPCRDNFLVCEHMGFYISRMYIVHSHIYRSEFIIIFPHPIIIIFNILVLIKKKKNNKKEENKYLNRNIKMEQAIQQYQTYLVSSNAGKKDLFEGQGQPRKISLQINFHKIPNLVNEKPILW